MNGKNELPAGTADDHRTDPVEEIFFVSAQRHVLDRTRLDSDEQAKLRSLIQGPVAEMTAEHLSGLLDTGLETDVRYRSVIAGMRERLLSPNARLSEMLAYLHQQAQTHSSARGQIRPQALTAVKVLLVEATARQLGKDWTQDTASFIDVTIAAARLQDIALALGDEAASNSANLRAPFAAIVLPRGEQHSLMAYLTGALFQTLGWQQQVVQHDAFVQPEIAATVARANVVCIGWSTMRLKANVVQLITDIKLQSGRADRLMIAGGAAALDFVEFLVETGVDCICDSVFSAVKIAESFYKLEKINHFAAPESGHAERRTSWIDRQSQ